jgi:FkbM family methyltransferase
MSISDAWKNFHRNRKIRRHYGETNPTHASVIGGDIPIRVDPSDGRARKKLLLDSIRGRASSSHTFWFMMLRHFDPTACIDIGLNFGECLLAGRLPSAAQGYGFEANLQLKPFIDETMQSHPDAERLHLCYATVADKAGEEATLWVDPHWSGKSTVAGDGGDGAVPVKTTTVTIDEQVPRPGAEDRVLFKIDIEGYEPVAFAGMHETIASAGRVVGFTEFSPTILQTNGVNLSGYWGFLAKYFSIYSCCAIGEAVRIDHADWASASEVISGRHGDLILLKGFSADEEDALITCWRGAKTT